MNAVKMLGVGAVSAALIVFVAVAGYILLAINAGLVTPDFFVGLSALVVFAGAWWLYKNNLGFIGIPFMVTVSLLLSGTMLRHRFPGAAKFLSQSSKEADRMLHNWAVDISAARVIPCDETTPKVRFFARENRAPLVWLSEDEDGRLICLDRPGYDSQTGKEYVPVDDKLAAAIRRQPPRTPEQVNAPATAPNPPQATPLPELRRFSLRRVGDGPVR